MKLGLMRSVILLWIISAMAACIGVCACTADDDDSSDNRMDDDDLPEEPSLIGWFGTVDGYASDEGRWKSLFRLNRTSFEEVDTTDLERGFRSRQADLGGAASGWAIDWSWESLYELVDSTWSPAPSQPPCAGTEAMWDVQRFPDGKGFATCYGRAEVFSWDGFEWTAKAIPLEGDWVPEVGIDCAGESKDCFAWYAFYVYFLHDAALDRLDRIVAPWSISAVHAQSRSAFYMVTSEEGDEVVRRCTKESCATVTELPFTGPFRLARVDSDRMAVSHAGTSTTDPFTWLIPTSPDDPIHDTGWPFLSEMAFSPSGSGKGYGYGFNEAGAGVLYYLDVESGEITELLAIPAGEYGSFLVAADGE